MRFMIPEHVYIPLAVHLLSWTTFTPPRSQRRDLQPRGFAWGVGTKGIHYFQQQLRFAIKDHILSAL